MRDNLEKAFDTLVKEIWGYESDTFSAEASELSCKEAEDIANKLVQRAIMDMINLNTLDDTIIDAELYDLREE